ncbi:MAG: tripartite tricarboxylate transporter substrate binding protein [Synergistales bacterium]|nr:tripartite tricarboxylate transporter substrate binding protein [Synergistales bacterium]
MFRKSLLLTGLAVALLVAFTGAALAANDDYPSRPFECIAPAGPGGGWDTTIRMSTKVLTQEGLIEQPMPVTNKPGGGGGVALSYVQKREGSPYTIIVYSPPLLLINLTGQTELSYEDVTPIAMLINDYGAFAVPKDSPYEDLGDVMEALRKDPKSVTIGGTSSPGSMDHIQFLKVAKAAGVKNLKEITYVPFQGGQSLAAAMGGHIDLVTTGMAETVGPMQSGEIRVLAITSPEPIAEGPMSQVPTVRQAGVDTEFINWRGLFGPPEMPQYAVDHLQEALSKMVKTEAWDEICTKNGWTKAFMGSEGFGDFLEKQNEQYKDLLKSINMYKGQ